MQKLKFPLLMILMAGLGLVSCKKEEDKKEDLSLVTGCKLTELQQNGTKVGTIEYNAQGRVAKSSLNMLLFSEVSTFSYSTNQITRLDKNVVFGFSDSTQTIYTLGSHGYATRKITYSYGSDTYDTTYYEYSPDGFLLRETNSSQEVTVYTYNGALISHVVRTGPGGAIDSIAYEFSAHNLPANFFLDAEELWVGKRFSRVPSSLTTYSQDDTSATLYDQYEFSDGNLKKMRVRNVSADENTENLFVFGYQCQ